jgi:hypothetical protein
VIKGVLGGHPGKNSIGKDANVYHRKQTEVRLSKYDHSHPRKVGEDSYNYVSI